MSVVTCEFCEKCATFLVREMDGGEPRERRVCAAHLRKLHMRAGTYVYGDRAFPSFTDFAAAVGASATDLGRASMSHAL